MSFIQMLRAGTAADHDAVDARFGAFRLDDQADYRRFLLAHARALPSVEAALAGDTALPGYERRTPLLTADLHTMGEATPPALPFDLDDPAMRWGALYVLEGSRLGGQMLARAVPPEWPRAYLSATHARGGWRALLDDLDAAATGADDAWRDAVLTGARRTFAHYLAAVGP